MAGEGTPDNRARTLPISVIGFRPEFLDFQRGIRVGNLQENERITRILKLALENRHNQPFVTDRWGRGVFWQWICFLPRANRIAKPESHHVNFGCSKFFIMVDVDEGLFKSGLQIERGFLKAPASYPSCQLRADWDWHRLIKGLKPGGSLERELKRLVLREGFVLQGGDWDEPYRFTKANLPGMVRLRKILESAPPKDWSGFQLYYPMPEEDVLVSSGPDLVEAMLAVFREVTPLMNLCMQIHLID